MANSVVPRPNSRPGLSFGLMLHFATSDIGLHCSGLSVQIQGKYGNILYVDHLLALVVKIWLTENFIPKNKMSLPHLAEQRSVWAIL